MILYGFLNGLNKLIKTSHTGTMKIITEADPEDPDSSPLLKLAQQKFV